MTYQEKLLDPRWQKKRLHILDRDQWTCKHCGGTGRTLHVHHLHYSYKNWMEPNQGYVEPWDEEDCYLITLCSTCHEEETETIEDAKKDLISSLAGLGFLAHHFYDIGQTLGCISDFRDGKHLEEAEFAKLEEVLVKLLSPQQEKEYVIKMKELRD